MITPIVLEDSGDLCLFESASDLERYVEAPDVAGYRVFDANGDLFRLSPVVHSVSSLSRSPPLGNSADSVRLEQDIMAAHAAEDLTQLLRAFLGRVTNERFDHIELSELLAEMRTRVGFTR